MKNFIKFSLLSFMFLGNTCAFAFNRIPSLLIVHNDTDTSIRIKGVNYLPGEKAEIFTRNASEGESIDRGVVYVHVKEKEYPLSYPAGEATIELFVPERYEASDIIAGKQDAQGFTPPSNLK